MIAQCTCLRMYIELYKYQVYVSIRTGLKTYNDQDQLRTRSEPYGFLGSESIKDHGSGPWIQFSFWNMLQTCSVP